jgi:hypothetical protein
MAKRPPRFRNEINASTHDAYSVVPGKTGFGLAVRTGGIGIPITHGVSRRQDRGLGTLFRLNATIDSG